MKKWIVVCAALLVIWNLALTFELHSQKTSAPNDSEEGITYIENTLNGYTTDITENVKNSENRVVSVTAYDKSGAVLRSASGVICYASATECDILTNARVFADAEFVDVTFQNSLHLDAILLGVDNQTDLAVVKTEPTFATQPMVFSDSSRIKSGEYVVAIGGKRTDTGNGTVSFGVVSSTGHLLREETDHTPAWLVEVLESDATVNQSNSGGPIVNLSGELVAVLSTSLTSAANNSGMAYGVSSIEAKLVSEELRRDGVITRGYLGLVGKDVSELETYEKSALNLQLDQIDGIYIQSLATGSPSEISGLQVGDVLTAINEETISDNEELLRYLYAHNSGDSVSVKVIRGTSVLDIPVVLE